MISRTYVEDKVNRHTWEQNEAVTDFPLYVQIRIIWIQTCKIAIRQAF